MNAETKRDRDLTDAELDAITGGTIRPPTNSTILINKPVFTHAGQNPQA